MAALLCYHLGMQPILDPERRADELEREVRTLNRTLAGQRHFLKIAAEYKHDDPAKRLDGIQAALAKAAEYEPRTQKVGRRHR